MKTRIESPAILLASGGYFYFEEPEESHFTIEDIAQALSNTCRFNGHCRQFYSVAQHCVLVSSHLPAALRWQGLMHDAAEAFIGDVTRPLKRLLPDYVAIEGRIQSAVFKKLGLPSELDLHVKIMDLRALLTEQRDVMKNWDEWPCLSGLTPFQEPILPLFPHLARELFLNRCMEVKP